MRAALKWLFFSLAGLSGLLLGALFAGHGVWLGAVAAVLGVALYSLAWSLHSNLLASVSFLFGTGLAGLAVWMDQPAWLALVALCFNLAGWNCFTFIHRMQKHTQDVLEPWIIRRYLLRLGGLTLAGFLTGAAALVIRVDLSFAGVILLAAVVFAGLVVGVRYLVVGAGERAPQGPGPAQAEQSTRENETARGHSSN